MKFLAYQVKVLLPENQLEQGLLWCWTWDSCFGQTGTTGAGLGWAGGGKIPVPGAVMLCIELAMNPWAGTGLDLVQEKSFQHNSIPL